MAAEAVEMWRRQSYPVREIVIVDDRLEPSFITPPRGAGIIYERAPRMSIGAKRNLACSIAHGDIICHWDSDDMYAPDRIADQVARLARTDTQMTGYCPLVFEDERGQRWLYISNDPHYAPGVTLMYWRDYWRRRPFPDLNESEDGEFQRGAKAIVVPGGNHIVARIHAGNTSSKRVTAPCWRRIV